MVKHQILCFIALMRVVLNFPRLGDQVGGAVTFTRWIFHLRINLVFSRWELSVRGLLSEYTSVNIHHHAFQLQRPFLDLRIRLQRFPMCHTFGNYRTNGVAFSLRYSSVISKGRVYYPGRPSKSPQLCERSLLVMTLKVWDPHRLNLTLHLYAGYSMSLKGPRSLWPQLC